MDTPFSFAGDRTKTALVIVFPPGIKGLFNPEIHQLVSEVQERLDGIYVTYALSSGVTPALRDAVSAARFMGYDSIVVVPVAGGEGLGVTDPRLTGDWLLTTSAVVSDLGVSAVVEACLAAVAEAERAA